MDADRRRPCTRNIRSNKFTTSHTSRASVDILRNIFSGRFISRFGGTFWPPRTADLTDPNTLNAHACSKFSETEDKNYGRDFRDSQDQLEKALSNLRSQVNKRTACEVGGRADHLFKEHNICSSVRNLQSF